MQQYAEQHMSHKELMKQRLATRACAADGQEDCGLASSESAESLARRRNMQEHGAAAGGEEPPGLDALAALWAPPKTASLASAVVDASDASDATVQPAPIRLHVRYQNLTALTAAQQATLQSVTSTMLTVLANYISVRVPVQGQLLVSPVCRATQNRTCRTYYPAWPSDASCGQAAISKEHVLNPRSCTGNDTSTCVSYNGTASGQAADMYLYVTAVQDAQCNAGAAAWAMSCLYDTATNRPMLGNANVCPASIGSIDADKMVAIMSHEVLHALGFTSVLFNNYIDPISYDPLPAASVSRIATVAGKNVTLVVTPTVVREARAQFDCPDLIGAQLEDNGGSGSANSHWEYTHYQGDLMLATTRFSTAGEPARLSRMTLALLEDSGWYYGNWSAVGGPLQWGRGIGCRLPKQGCANYLANTPSSQQRLFCNATATAALGNALRYSVSSSYRSVGTCTNTTFTNTCGLVSARGGIPSCISTSYQYVDADIYGWSHGVTSRAFPITYKFSVVSGRNTMLFPTSGSQGDRDAVCFPSSCSNGQLFLTLGGTQVRCPSGQYVDLPTALPSLYRQGIIGPCPDEGQVCKTLDCGASGCSYQGGVCYDGRCVCKLGWTGDDCSYSILQAAAVATNGSLMAPASGNASDANDQRNLTSWYQTVQLTCNVTGISLALFQSRTSVFLAALAQWANVDASLISLVNITQPGAAVVAAAPAPPGKRRARALMSSIDLSWLGLGLGPGRRLQASNDVKVTVEIRPGSLSATGQLWAQLADDTQLTALTSAMSTAGFTVPQASLSSKLVIRMEVVTMPGGDSGDGGDAGSSSGQGDSNSGKDKGKQLVTRITIIALVLAAGFIATVVIVVAVTCVRNRRLNREGRGDNASGQLPDRPGDTPVPLQKDPALKHGTQTGSGANTPTRHQFDKRLAPLQKDGGKELLSSSSFIPAVRPNGAANSGPATPAPASPSLSPRQRLL